MHQQTQQHLNAMLAQVNAAILDGSNLRARLRPMPIRGLTHVLDSLQQVADDLDDMIQAERHQPAAVASEQAA